MWSVQRLDTCSPSAATASGNACGCYITAVLAAPATNHDPQHAKTAHKPAGHGDPPQLLSPVCPVLCSQTAAIVEAVLLSTGVASATFTERERGKAVWVLITSCSSSPARTLLNSLTSACRNVHTPAQYTHKSQLLSAVSSEEKHES
jgi:hypothetical protein